MHSKDRSLIWGSWDSSDEEELSSATGSVCSCERIDCVMSGISSGSASKCIESKRKICRIIAWLPYQFLETPDITIGLRAVYVTNRAMFIVAGFVEKAFQYMP